MKSLIIIFVVLIVGIMFVVIWNYNSHSQIDRKNFNEISWRLPLDKEVKNIGDSFDHSEIEICANYFIKKIGEEKYLIACGTNGTWTYYTAYTGQQKVYQTPTEHIASLIPPEMPEENLQKDQLKRKSKTPINTGSSKDIREAR
jgi:hypothetical protein